MGRRNAFVIVSNVLEHLCGAFYQRISGLYSILKKKYCVVGNLVIGFLLLFLKWKLSIWVRFKLPISHPVMEIVLPMGDFLLPGTIKLTRLLNLVRLTVTWGYVNHKTHQVCRCSEVYLWSTDGVKIYKMQSFWSISVFALISDCSVVAKSTKIMFTYRLMCPYVDSNFVRVYT